mgnify:CR=1 FL=1
MKHTMRVAQPLFALIVIAMMLVTLITQRAAAPPLIPPQVRVAPTNPKAGVHTRLTGIADARYVATQLDMVAAMGTPWIVDLFPWAYAQPRSAYGYDWRGFDMLIDHAHARGLRIIARLDIVPAWARPAGSSDRLLLPQRYAAYRDYVVAFTQRYHTRGVSHIIIWNEPNLRFEWGGRAPDPQAYAQLLASVYPAVKAVAPEMTVIAGALSPGPSIGDQAEVRLGDEAYTEAFFDAGGGKYIDAWGVHAYGGQHPADDDPNWQTVNFRRTELIYKQISRYVDVPLYITEGGWNDASRWQLAVTPAQRIRWSIAAYQRTQSWPWAEVFAVWQFGLPTPSRSYQDGWNMVASDGTPRAIYTELQAVLSQQSGTTP